MNLTRNILWAAVLLCGALAAQSVSIEYADGAIRVRGATALSVRTDAPDAPDMLGTTSTEQDNLVFRPRFPLSPGLTYIAEATLVNGEKLTRRIELPPIDLKPVTRTEHVYPSADVLPANILKLYIHFSGPMSKGEAWQRIHLLDAEGKPVPLAFLEVDQELWDAGGKRLTVLFDPGRIKRGLVPTNDMGSPITEGRSYRLVIDRGWHDAHGAPLVDAFEKRFTGGPSERRTPSTDRWRIDAPKAGTTNPLVIHFPSPMDAALLKRMIEVENVEGTIGVTDLEREWRFTPHQPWRAMTYRIIADNLLEDISGNHLDRPFDVDLSTLQAVHRNGSGTSSVSFTVR